MQGAPDEWTTDGADGPIHADLIRADPSGPLNPWSISNPNLASCLTPALLDNDHEYELRVDKPEARGVDSPHLWWLVSALDSKLDRIMTQRQSRLSP